MEIIKKIAKGAKIALKWAVLITAIVKGIEAFEKELSDNNFDKE